MTLGRQEKYTEAILFLQKAVKIDPKLGSAWGDLGVIYFKIGELDKAIQAFKRVITVSTINEIIDNSYLNLTYIYLMKDDVSNTKQNYEALRKRNPSLTSRFLSELKESRDLWERFQKMQRR
jgi:Flp pilus assembly protein TadD